jgi:hypothetical protein
MEEIYLLVLEYSFPSLTVSELGYEEKSLEIIYYKKDKLTYK